MATFRFSSRSVRHMAGVDDMLIAVAYCAISISPIDFGIPKTGGLRSAVTQNELFILGKSKCDGYDKLSRHQSGKALDFFAYVDGKASWEPEHLAMVGAAFLQAAITMGVDIQWGGLWKGFRDMPHVELVDIHRVANNA